MGRWAQARHRGRGNAAASGFALAPPSSDIWSINPFDTGQVNVLLPDSVCTIGSDGFFVRYGINVPPTDPLAVVDGPFECDFNEVIIAFPGATVNAQIAWSSAGAQVSDWSTVQSAIAP
jgi:hypothetical protein